MYVGMNVKNEDATGKMRSIQARRKKSKEMWIIFPNPFATSKMWQKVYLLNGVQLVQIQSFPYPRLKKQVYPNLY